MSLVWILNRIFRRTSLTQRFLFARLQSVILVAIICVLMVIALLHEQAGDASKRLKQHWHTYDIQKLSINILGTELKDGGNSISFLELQRKPTTAERSPRNPSFSHLRPREFTLPDPEPIGNHYLDGNNATCLKYGTQAVVAENCVCKKGWYGTICDVPDCVEHCGNLNERNSLTIRRHLRRIIYAVPFNIEFEMIEVIISELCDIVDVFIIAESPFTAFGSRKPVRLLPKLHRKYLKKCHDKIVYLYMDHFPLGGRKNGWVADSYIRSFVGMKGLPHIHNIRADDLFIVFDLDEIPSRESLIFLKTHDGYPEPFGFRLRWSVFGFYWKNNRYTQITAGCTVGMLSQVHRNKSNQIRDLEHGLFENQRTELAAYKRTHLVRSWFLGSMEHFAGWHCSSCMDIHGIKIKFISAQNGDYPRWGSNHDKMDLNYIRNIVRNGKWFDGGNLGDKVTIKDDPYFAPSHVLNNYERYKYLLSHDHNHDDHSETKFI